MLDLLGRPISKGDLVLTNSYGAAALTEVTTVLKVNLVTCTVKVKDRYAIWRNKYYGESNTEFKEMKRTSDKVVVITEQLDHNRIVYPELYV